MAWYCGLLIYQRITDHQLVVNRTPFWMKDPDYPSEYIQQAEIIDHTWQITPRRGLQSGFDDPEEPKDGANTRQREADPFETSSEEGGVNKQKKWPWKRESKSTTMTDGRRLSDGFEG